MDDARPAASRRHLRIPLLSIAPAALLPAWWDPAYSAITIAGLACLALAALIAVRTRAKDPWRRVARAAGARPGRTGHAATATMPPPAAGTGEPFPVASSFSLPPLPAALAGAARPRLDRTPGMSPVALHVVTGSDREGVVRGVVETAAQMIARGGRVLILDAGRRLDLHACFGGESRWGLAECAGGRLPMLGVVQSTGRAGLFLLARGHADTVAPWATLGQLLDEAAGHFDRVIVALDPDCPAAAAPAFGPRALEGWWAGDGSRPRAALAFTERVGIPLAGLQVPASVDALLRGLGRAARAAARPGAPEARSLAGVAPARDPGTGLVIAAAPVEARAPIEWSVAAPVAPRAPIEFPVATPDTAAWPSGTPCRLREADEPVAPVVLASDPRVGERLRFLGWARRLGDPRPAPRPRGDAAPALELVGAS